MINIIADKNGKLTQWDKDRRAIFENVVFSDGDEVHFSSAIDEHDAYVVLPYEENGKIYADIPNILLQQPGIIYVYYYPLSYTKYSSQFYVERREKPDDYVYTETEIYDYRLLEQKIGDLSNLETENKEDLVSAINEANQNGGSGSGGKIDSVTVNGEVQPITGKNVEITVSKATVGLSNVDNTADNDKPISTQTQKAIDEITAKVNKKIDQTKIVTPLADSTDEQVASAKAVYDMIGNIQSLIDGM